jgi:hypothetical protein
MPYPTRLWFVCRMLVMASSLNEAESVLERIQVQTKVEVDLHATLLQLEPYPSRRGSM